MRRARILVCLPGGFFEEQFTAAERAELATFGELLIRTDLSGKDAAPAYNALIREFRPEILITGWGTPLLQADTVRAVPELKYMCHATGTIRANITKEAMAAGVIVTNWGPMVRGVAESALMMILAAQRRVYEVQKRMHEQGAWPRELGGCSLYGARVGIYGLGYIGRELVRLLKPFDCDVSAYDPYVADAVFAESGVRRQTSLAALFRENEVVSIHAGRTAENTHSVNAEMLKSMPDSAVLVNTARGSIIDEVALARELETGRISAAMDVFEKEPLPEDSPLRRLPNVLLFPHFGSGESRRGRHHGEYAMANLRRYLAGEPLEAVIPIERYDLMT